MAKSECSACGNIFSSVSAFDEHRTGSFAKRSRRCLTGREMQGKRMTKNEKGWWTLPLSNVAVPWFTGSIAHEETKERKVLHEEERRKSFG